MTLTLSMKRRHLPASGKLHSRSRHEAPPESAALPENRQAPTARTRVTIQYCELANYGPVARHLEQAIAEEFRGFPVDVELVPSRGGVYEVSVDGRLIYSKRATLRLPDPDEIFYHVRTAIPGQQAGPSPSLT